MKHDNILSASFFRSLLKLTRVGNLLIIALTQYFTAGFLIGMHTLNDVKLLLLSVSTISIAAGGYIINDYYDVKIDYINKPSRVVIGKSITRRYAILFHVLLSTIGVALGIYLSLGIGVVNAVSVFLLWLYSNNLKRLPFIGNVTVAFLTGLAVIVVDLFYRTNNSLVVIYALFAFFITLVREVIKDMEDLKGDNSFGCKTLPIIWGIRKTKLLLYVILVTFAGIVVILNQLYRALPFKYHLIFLFVPLLWLLYRLIRADMKKDFTRLSIFCKVIMMLGILSMAFM
jgi:4-hydroxybenzoate polyprenyltransferase